MYDQKIMCFLGEYMTHSKFLLTMGIRHIKL